MSELGGCRAHVDTVGNQQTCICVSESVYCYIWHFTILKSVLNPIADGRRVNRRSVKLGYDESLDQFYGIEINDFAVSVARTALWIAENQMMEQTKKLIVNATDLTFLPLSSLTHIKEENALRYDWKKLLSPEDCSYIMGNPPFIGYSLQSPEQKEDILSIYINEEGKPYKTAGKIDYVDCPPEFDSTEEIKAFLQDLD